MRCTSVAAFGAEASRVSHGPDNSSRMASARVWSRPISSTIGARIASDFAGRVVHPPSGRFPPRGRLGLLPRRGAGHDLVTLHTVLAATWRRIGADSSLQRPAVERQILHLSRTGSSTAPRSHRRPVLAHRGPMAQCPCPFTQPVDACSGGTYRAGSRVASRRERHRDLARQAAALVAQLCARATSAPGAANEAATRSVSN